MARSVRQLGLTQVTAREPRPEPRADGLDYVDIFYSHLVDPDTPLEETLGALDTAVRQGKALYVGISSYSGARTAQAIEILRELGTPLLIHQPSYSMVNRWIERDLVDVLGKHVVVVAVAVTFSLDELTEIDHHARDLGIDLWAESSSA